MSTQLLLTDEQLPDYLRGRGLFEPDEGIRVTAAGDGNINWVRRATSERPQGTSWIVKQARPALERFPQYQAPTERLLYEAAWIAQARPCDRDGVCPEVRDLDRSNRVLVLEDLGDALRLDAALEGEAAVEAPVLQLASFLGRVHRATSGEAGLVTRFQNGPMQRLHGDHIFSLPYQEEFPLPPATAEEAGRLRADTRLPGIAAAAYRRYLEPRGALVHGDVQAGNILLPAAGVKLLDAEIAHVGDPAFDLGMLLAHLALPALARGHGERVRKLLVEVWKTYSDAALPEPDAGADPRRAMRYAGLELLRRTIGAARVAAVAGDSAGLRVIAAGRAWVLQPEAPESAPL